MNTMQIEMTLHYDDHGNVTGYEMVSPPQGTPDVLHSVGFDLEFPPVVKASRIVRERLVGAINAEFGLPPIPGMPR